MIKTMIKQVTIVTCLLLLGYNAIAQNFDEDISYRQQTHIIDSITSRGVKAKTDSICFKRNIKKAAEIYTALSEKYYIDDLVGFFYYSIASEAPVAFYTSARLMILNTGDSISHLIKKYGNVYGGADVSRIYKGEMGIEFNKLKRDEANLIAQARMHIDWKWNMDICAINKANIDFRLVQTDFFKDSVSKVEAYLLIDSTHFAQFCNLVQNNGYPYRELVGLNSFQIMAPLKHFTALLMLENDRGDFFIAKWKWLMPFLQKAAVNGSIDHDFYQNLIDNWITSYLKKANKAYDISFFEKYKLIY